MAEYMLLKPAAPGVRRRLTYVLHETSAGASMPLTRHQKALSCSMLGKNCMAKIRRSPQENQPFPQIRDAQKNAAGKLCNSNGLFEVRTMDGSIARGLWVYQTGQNIFVLRIFIKKHLKRHLQKSIWCGADWRT